MPAPPSCRALVAGLMLLIGLLGPLSPVSAQCLSFLRSWSGTTSGSGQMGSPSGIAADQAGFVYVLDQLTNSLHRFSPDGAPLQVWNCGASVFPGPFGLSIGPNGVLYVADPAKNLVQKFNTSGAFLGSWGVTRPVGVAADRFGNVFVADSQNQRIQKFTSSGSFLGSWNATGTSAGPISNAEGIAVDQDGFVYVCDRGNHRVVKFTNDGAFVSTWYGSPAYPFGGGQPTGITVGPNGHVFTTETLSWNRVQEFTSNGDFVCLVGVPPGGNTPAQFEQPIAVACDPSGNVFVADRTSNIDKPIVFKFGPLPTSVSETSWGRIKTLYR